MRQWLAGTGSVCFTPDEPLWLAGYAVRTGPSQGTLSDLYVTALALRDADGRTVVLASVDIIAIPASLADDVAAIVRAKHPEISRDHFIFAASHTHFAPEIRPDKVFFFKIPPEYAAKIQPAADRLRDAIASAILQSLSNLTPVRIHARRGTATFAHNRRPHSGLHDHDVPVLDLRNPDDSIKSILYGYACHNTTMDPQDRLYSADWSGFARERLKQLYPACAPLFITGCGADQNPEPRGTKDLSKQHGLELAASVEQALNGPSTEVAPSLRIAAEKVRLDMRPVTEASLAEALASNDLPRIRKAQHLQDRLARDEQLETSYHGPMQVLRLGHEVLLILMSGETVVDWSHKFKLAFTGNSQLATGNYPLVWVAGYCNDMYGYIPTARLQREGGYEGGRANLWSWLPSPWTDTVESNVTAAIERLVRKVTES